MICQHFTSFLRLAIGHEDGSVEIYAFPSLTHQVTLKTFSKLIQCLSWHPAYIGASGDASLMADWLAVSSNETAIHVFDVKKVLADVSDKGGEAMEVEGEEEKGQQRALCVKPAVELSGHHLRVIQVVWSPHEDGKLASVSYDTTAQVQQNRSNLVSRVLLEFRQYN